MNIKLIIAFITVWINTCPAFAQLTEDNPISYRKPLFDFDPRKPVFKLSGEQQYNKNRMLRFSVLTGYRQGVEPIQGFGNFTNNQDYESGTSRIYMYNLSIQDMLTHGLYKSNRVVLEVKDPSRYRYDTSQGIREEWMRKNAYCFELLFPMGTMTDASLLQKELARVFGVEFGLKKRLVNALVLVRTSNKDKLKTQGIGERRYTRQGYLNNITLDKLSSIFYDAGFPPLVDETGYSGLVDLDLQMKSETDLPALRKSLQDYDLDLKEEKREIEMFVITEIK